MEAKSECLMVCDVTAPTVAKIAAALAAMGPGSPKLQDDAASSDMVAVCKATVAPLDLVHRLLGSPFLTPINAWNLVVSRAAYLGLERRVTPLLHWLWYQMSAHTGAVDAFSSVNLADATLNQGKTRGKISPPLHHWTRCTPQ